MKALRPHPTADKSASQTASPVNHRKLIMAAFRDLRNIGFIAKARFMCCQGCARAAIRELIKDDKWATADIVFYHAQDAEAFDGNGTLKRSIHIAHSGDTMKAVDAFRLKGLIVKWDGNKNTRIEILPKLA